MYTVNITFFTLQKFHFEQLLVDNGVLLELINASKQMYILSQIRESFYSKLATALSSNYRTTSSKQSSLILTESNICVIAKKIELGTLSVASNLYSYKLSGAEKVSNQ